jgi:hypothetical protein
MLVANPCRTLCAWRPSAAAVDDLFVCAGCGSQWMPSEPWTPIDADGHIPAPVRAARVRKS